MANTKNRGKHNHDKHKLSYYDNINSKHALCQAMWLYMKIPSEDVSFVLELKNGRVVRTFAQDDYKIIHWENRKGKRQIVDEAKKILKVFKKNNPDFLFSSQKKAIKREKIRQKKINKFPDYYAKKGCEYKVEEEWLYDRQNFKLIPVGTVLAYGYMSKKKGKIVLFYKKPYLPRNRALIDIKDFTKLKKVKQELKEENN